MTASIHRCPACGKRLWSEEGVIHHIRDRHARTAQMHLHTYRPGQFSAPRPAREPSMASLFIEAEIARGCGDPVDPDIAEMLP